MAQHQYISLDVCIFLTILWPFTIPLYIYGFLKWQKFRHHFLVSKRFPKITYFLGVAAILEHLLISSIFWLHYYKIHNSATFFLMSCSEAFMFAALSIVLYRIFLIYLSWRQLQNTLNTVVDNDNNNKTKNAISIKPYHHKLSYCFIIFIAIGTIGIMFKENIYANINRTIWTATVIIGIILGIFVRIQKVKEGIGLLLESRIIVMDVIGILILLQFESYNKILAHFSHYLQVVSILLWCLMPLYLTLYYIYKFEGTLSSYKHGKNVKQNKKTSPDKKSIETVLDIMAKDNTHIENDNKITVEMKEINKAFDVFLENHDNYKLFARYLGHCFAIENMLFLERVSIFNVIVNRLNEQETEICSSDDEMNMKVIEDIKNNDSVPSANSMMIQTTNNDSNPSANDTILSTTNAIQLIRALSLSSSVSNSQNFKKIPKLRFEFLTKMYDEYYNIINNNVQNNSFINQKDGLDIIVNKIYNQFIMNDSVNMVNIAYKTRSTIIELINNKSYFKTYHDYVHLFDDSLSEIYQLNQSLYNYRFRSYIDQTVLYKE